MNRKGFTLIEILAVIIIIGIVAIISIPTVSQYIKSAENTTYKSYENSMKEATKNRITKCLVDNDSSCVLPEKIDEKRIVYLSELIDNGFLDEMKSPETKELCEIDVSYVEVKKTGLSDYDYVACLYCGDYTTDNASCTAYNYDNTPPVCGEVTGASTRWTSNNRTISVRCIDNDSGCRENTFSKTFSKTTKEGAITIVDKSGMTTSCPVNVYVDKTAPTCTLTIAGDYVGAAGWYAEGTVVKLTEKSDTENDILTYGIGTSIDNRDYNKKTTLEPGRGITTVIGYVKDTAGNEGICSVDVRIGAANPNFDFDYGYQIYPKQSNDNVSYTLSGITVNGNSHETTTTTPTIKINDLSKYQNIDRVAIKFSEAIPTNTIAMIRSDSMSSTATMVAGSDEVVFKITKGTYDSLTIQLGDLANKTYKISKIEVYTKSGAIATNKDVEIDIKVKDAGVRTTAFSFDDGISWQVDKNHYFTENASQSMRTKSEIGLISDPQPYDISKIDKIVPTCSLKLNGTISGDGERYITDVNISFDDYSDLGGSEVRRYGINSATGSKTITHSSNSSDPVTYKGVIEDNAGNLTECPSTFIKNSILKLSYEVYEGTACADKSVTYLQPYGDLCNSTKIGYDFVGWFLDADLDKEITAEDTVTETIDHTAHAIWDVRSYDIAYDLDNGTFNYLIYLEDPEENPETVPVSPSHPTTADYDQNLKIDNPKKTITITVDQNGTNVVVEPIEQPQIFRGWTYTGGNTSTARYGETEATINNSWASETSARTETYYKNLRSEEGTVTLKANWTSVNVQIPESDTGGYVCTLNTKRDGSGTTYNFGSTYTVTNSTPTEITLYLICTVEKYTITFDVNGGNDWTSSTCKSPSTFTSSNKSCKKQVTYGLTYGDLPVPTRSGYDFAGWYTSAADTGGTRIGSTSTVTIKSNTTYYARWTNDASNTYLDPCTSYGAREDPWDSDYCIFSGLNPDNYVRFNGTSGDKSLYRILNVYKKNFNSTGKLQMKIIYNGTDYVCSNSVPYTAGTSEGKCYYLLNNTSYASGYYKTVGSTWRDFIDTTSEKFYYGQVSQYQHNNKYIADTITGEKGLKGAFFAGMLSVSDYMKASDDPACNKKTNSWEKLNTGDSVSACTQRYCCSRPNGATGNWLFGNTDYGLHFMNYHNNDRVRLVKGGMKYYNNWKRQMGHLSYDTKNVQLVAKPVHLLKDTVRVIGGSGTKSDPYIIANIPDLAFSGQTINKSFSTSAQTATFTAASEGSGNYTYTEVSEKNNAGNSTNYISVSGTTITIAANTPADNYVYVIRVKDTTTQGTKTATFQINVNKVNATLTCKNTVYNGTEQTLYTAATGCTSVTNGKKTNAGTYTLSCVVDGNHNAPSNCNSVIQKATPSFVATESSLNIQTGGTATFGVLSYTVPGTLGWSSDNPSIVEIDLASADIAVSSNTVNNQVVATVVGYSAGSVNTHVSFHPNDSANYNDVIVHVAVTAVEPCSFTYGGTCYVYAGRSYSNSSVNQWGIYEWDCLGGDQNVVLSTGHCTELYGANSVARGWEYDENYGSNGVRLAHCLCYNPS